MAQNDVLKRYIDTGLAFTALTQARAEALVKDLVKAGEVQADQAREVVSDLVERSRKNSEKLLETVRREVKQQITSLGLVSKADLDKAEARLASLVGAATKPVRKAAAEGARRAQEPPPRRRPPRRPRPRRRPAKKARPPRSRPEPLVRRRLDAELVRRGLAPSRSRPRRTSTPVGSPSAARPPRRRRASSRPDEPIVVLGPPPRFVGRGGEKLDAALERFARGGRRPPGDRPRRVDRRVHRLPPPAGRGVGGRPSTSGYGQLHERLRTDPTGGGPRAHQRPRADAR